MLNVIFDSTNNRFVIPFKDQTIQVQAAIVGSFDATYLTATNYIGIAAEAISDGATGKINIAGGVNSGQTGLTTAEHIMFKQMDLLVHLQVIHL